MSLFEERVRKPAADAQDLRPTWQFQGWWHPKEELRPPQQTLLRNCLKTWRSIQTVIAMKIAVFIPIRGPKVHPRFPRSLSPTPIGERQSTTPYHMTNSRRQGCMDSRFRGNDGSRQYRMAGMSDGRNDGSRERRMGGVTDDGNVGSANITEDAYDGWRE